MASRIRSLGRRARRRSDAESVAEGLTNVEWVETTASTVEEAKDRALDRLGVAEDDAEFEVLEEPTKKMFGLRSTDARVRARVKPVAPRPKRERRRSGGGGESRNRKKKSNSRSGGARGGGESTVSGHGDGGSKDEKVAASNGGRQNGGQRSGQGGGRSGGKASNGGRQAASSGRDEGESAVTETVTLDEQVTIATEFLEGLLEAYDYDAEIGREDVDEDTAELKVTGSDLGLLVGPRGTTLSSLNEVMRTVLQRTAGGRAEGRVRVDVAGYRERRREALAKFTEEQAAQAIETGQSRALEPMNSADRKVVHDTANDIDGVTTVSEGEDPRRWVVIVPTA